ncbi:MAG: hypothetical protein AMJ88_10770 [Anaerolineae bacterium SM23_ 63]|nr:MAG: hypothetical protein AMJ88_10770 [Anaerolineae bacterium SM23_ 63]HEY48252.1 hypothetical protein [Anaerolineae bacterium]
MLLTITLIVNFLGLIMALWLGFYVITRSPRKPIAWLSGLALWSLSGNFLNILLALNPPPVLEQVPSWFRIYQAFIEGNLAKGANSWLEGWLLVPSIMLWHHVTMLMRPGGMNLWRRIRVIFGYLISLSAIYLQVTTPYLLVADPEGDPLYINTLNAGSLYPIFFILLLGYILMSAMNLLRSVQDTSSRLMRKQLTTLVIATLIAGMTIPLSFLGSLIGIRIPVAIPSALLILTLTAIGVGVTRYSALMEGRTLRKDFLFNAITMAGVTILYVLVSLLSVWFFGVPPGIFVFVIMFAVITHSLVDLVRRSVDVIVYRHETRELREKLIGLAYLISERGGMAEYLQRALREICVSVKATSGIIVVFGEDELQVAARHLYQGDLNHLSEEDLKADDVLHIEGDRLPMSMKVALLVPLYAEGKQVGALLLGRPKNAMRYSNTDIDRQLYPSDKLADVIKDMTREPERIALITSLVEKEAMKRREEVELIDVSVVEDALRNLSDYAYLGHSSLVSLELVTVSTSEDLVTHIDRGKVLRNLITDTIEKLRPSDEPPGEIPPREWHPYVILHDAYVMDIPNRDIIAKLYISEGTFNRTRRSAIRAIARAMSEMEGAVETET